MIAAMMTDATPVAREICAPWMSRQDVAADGVGAQQVLGFAPPIQGRFSRR